MIGVPGTAHRLFGALREEGISVILISQGSSEHSICCAIPQARSRARRARGARGVRARARGRPDPERRGRPKSCAILAVVGDGMAGTPGVSAKVFNALGAAAVNVRAIAQGASERNISVVVDGKHATRALRAAHAGFYLSPNTLSIGLIGPGTVGRVLLDQLAVAAARACARVQARPARARHHGAARRCCSSEQGVDAEAAGGRSSRPRSTPADIATFVDHVHVDHLPHTVIIDCTADERRGQALRRLARAPASTWSRRTRRRTAPSSAYYDSLKDARRTGGVALPVRSHGRRGPAGDPDAARPARDRRRDLAASKASSPARSPICSTCTTAAMPFSAHRARTRRQPAIPSRIRATICRARTSRAS